MKLSYLKIYFVLSAVLIAVTGVVNYLVDPLWYGKGNQITDKNFYFNERVSKTNLFLRTGPENYDCLIIGSSRATSLKASWFEGKNCFNFAFDGGKIEDYVEYAEFAKEQGTTPKTIYVAVDALNFWESRHPVNQPDQPQKSFQAYLSSDVLLFSIKTLLDISPSPRYYNQQFEGEVEKDLPPYKPELISYYRKYPKLVPERVEKFSELRDVFPDAKYIGFVPPISAWNLVNKIYGPGFIDSYFDALYEVTDLFDEMYDFSVPSEITKNPKNSYDSGHYYSDVQVMIADTLQRKEPVFGLVVNQESFSEYKQDYLTKIEDFLAEQDSI